MDEFGIVYLIQNAQQFWSELEDILNLPSAPTLSRLDSTLKRFISLCATYHEQYLQSSLQLEHACQIILQSELFTFHSERMCDIITDEAQTTTDPHTQLILYNMCLLRGRQHPAFLRSHKRWQPLIPLLMDHILVDVDPDVQDTYTGSTTAGSSGSIRGIAIPIEAKIRSLSVRLLYEVCRVQTFSLQDLRVFDDSFLDYLFDLVEQTRSMQDDTFNYSVIKLIVALNEQFMVASLPATGSHKPAKDSSDNKRYGDNRIVNVLMVRLGSSQTFGENLIFMLNRAGRTPEDLCMQLLVLKVLYILFTTKGTSEYFYTNDLCVLVDVFLREVVDLDEDSEALRHTYLRVLHPLLTKTQLRSVPYKRPQIVRALESLVANSNIRDISPTTKRLVDRCLNGDWCVQLRKIDISLPTPMAEAFRRVDSPSSMTSSTFLSPQDNLARRGSLKSSRSAENIRSGRHPERERVRKASKESADSLPNMASAALIARRKDRVGPYEVDTPTQDYTPDSPAATDDSYFPSSSHSLFFQLSDDHSTYGHDHNDNNERRHASVSPSPNLPKKSSTTSTGRRSAPPAPPKRRKPPAVPETRTRGRATMTTIASSLAPTAKSPLSKPSFYM